MLFIEKTFHNGRTLLRYLGRKDIIANLFENETEELRADICRTSFRLPARIPIGDRRYSALFVLFSRAAVKRVQ